MPLKSQKRRLGWTCRARKLPLGWEVSGDARKLPIQNTWGLFQVPATNGHVWDHLQFVCLTAGIVPLLHCCFFFNRRVVWKPPGTERILEWLKNICILLEGFAGEWLHRGTITMVINQISQSWVKTLERHVFS